MTTLEARAVRVPVEEPTRISTRLLDKRDYVLVRVRRGDCADVGIGYAYAGTSGGGLLAGVVDELLAPVVVGADAGDIVGLWERMYQETLLVGRRGGVVRAMSAVDIALWDLAAKRAGVPLAVLLGGRTGPVPAYASGGYYKPGSGTWTDAVIDEITRDRDQGFRDHKIKVGGLPVREDASRVAAAVEAMGPDGRLALDANNGYRTPAEALTALRAFERAAGDAGLWWFEEPLPADDLAGHASLRQRSDTPIATGEIAQTRWEFREMLARGAADLLQPDAGVLGGVTEYVRVVRAAEVFAVPVAPHWHANLHAHLAAASSNCTAVEHFTPEKDIYNFERLLTPETRMVAADGHVVVSARPGLGFELDEGAVEAFAVGPWTAAAGARTRPHRT
ncbi:mandelate racemase/muconate lactonizing enzyme family protein [Geodermatophilus sp. DSM 44513]|uniref:mandelate racemase/muconate lactonizing enzyme family protein n=1 Tax=Geodermatophilus sp. DSM 44513 TaxID=1528104 RepID=UPI001AA0F3F6|nr:mandelate racemase/muconate lactonizing enzyme family protein [Geodermatophilus sp. DSM 44513]WNV75076.1 mandelate racemase/muconate lactonizing enzyme family protein [Geodermatophilus sp. DSM 44513]